MTLRERLEKLIASISRDGHAQFYHEKFQPLVAKLLDAVDALDDMLTSPDAQCFSDARIHSRDVLTALAEYVEREDGK